MPHEAIQRSAMHTRNNKRYILRSSGENQDGRCYYAVVAALATIQSMTASCSCEWMLPCLGVGFTASRRML